MKTRLAVAAVVVLAVIARLPGVLWGVDIRYGGPFIYYSHDEFGAVRALMGAISSGAMNFRKDYFHGFGFEMLPVLALLKAATGALPEVSAVIAVRLTNVLYGAATATVTMSIARRITGDRRVALAAGALLALFPLHVLHSHYATPAVSATFWATLSAWAAFRHRATGRPVFLLACAAAAGAAIAVKFLFAALIPVAALVAATRSGWRWRAAAVVSLAAGFIAFNLGTMPWDQLPSIRSWLMPDNFGSRERHEWLTPLMYVVGLVPGLGLVSFAAAAGGTALFARRGFDRDRFFFLELPAVAHFAAISAMSSSFIRHAVPLLPWLAVAAGLGVVAAWDALRAQSARLAVVMLAAAAMYQVETVAWMGRQHVLARGAEARAWLLKNAGEGRTVTLGVRDNGQNFNPLRIPDSMRAPVPAEADYVVLSESMILLPLRRSILNPLTDRPGPSERYGWNYLSDPALVERILDGRSSFRLAASFPVREIMPEFILHKRLFGTWNWLEGDVDVYGR